ncbi:MAG: Hsp20/alpha crystallin family protein [Gammaproteobacteria bacterium]|nr:Hsp20/alpha crystallin family protein [Gammaproteobacteria bacterium]
MTQTHKKSTPKVTTLHENKASAASRMLAPFEEFEQFFNQLRNRDWMHPFHWPDAVQSHIPMFAEGKIPKVDIIDNDKDLLIRAELPGVDKKDLDISMTDNTLTIKASTSYEYKEEKSHYYRSEIAQGQYLRTLGLPADVDIDHAKSTFENGVLEMTVPKLKHSQRRSIKID